MNNKTPTAALLIRLEERLRQERETFDQRKKQESLWFLLRLSMGILATIMLPGIALFCGYILFNSHLFNDNVVVSAGVALFVDVVGLMFAVWKIVLNPKSSTKLEPIIKDEPLGKE